MMLRFNCPFCSAKFKIENNLGGQAFACPCCHRQVQAPGLPAPPGTILITEEKLNGIAQKSSVPDWLAVAGHRSPPPALPLPPPPPVPSASVVTCSGCGQMLYMPKA